MTLYTKKLLLVFVVLLMFVHLSCAQFKTEQKRYSRVRTAYSEKEDKLKKELNKKGFDTFANEMIIVAYKKEEELQVWLKNGTQKNYQLFKTYPFCSFSGVLGPKRREGDLQIPEGLYYIRNYNPYSSFYLSLGINYPNASDRVLSDKSKPGSHIYIHGDCATIGCIPITDDKIKEVYLLAVEAKNIGREKVPVYIFPAHLTDNNFAQLKDEYKDNNELIAFWTNLKTAYDKFIATKNNIVFSVDKNGKYKVH